MPSTHETGHAKNVANFETLIAAVVSYGATYNPSKETITLPALQTKLATVKEIATSTSIAFSNYTNAVAQRDLAYEPLRKLSTRMMNALKATDVSSQLIANAMTIHRKLTGARASVKLNKEEIEVLKTQGKEVKQISASQQSYDSILDALDKQLKLFAVIPQYAPNEIELKLNTLQNVWTNLSTKNQEVIDAKVELANKRIIRNQSMYNKTTGMVANTLAVKNYIKSLFGNNSAESKLISSLDFPYIKI